MGSCLSFDQDERKARARSDQIDRDLQHFAKEQSGIIRLLLLGAGESGKSTLVKQMKIIHNDGFTTEELKTFKPAVLDNLTSSMKYVLTGMGLLMINLENHKNRIHAQTVLSCQRCFDGNNLMLPHIANSLNCLWNDRGVRHAVSRGFEFDLNDSAIYYFENMERICRDSYLPSPEDVLRARVRTTGVIETCFKVNDCIFRLFDVGGQRSERRKWIQCFDDVMSILFVVALSGYDMRLIEDSSVNRMEESLRLFASICNNRFFTDTSLILFLNKMDLFQEKILHSGRHLRYYFTAYRGADHDVHNAALFIQHMFISECLSPSKVLYPHFTTATDTSNIQVVFKVVMDTIIRENLQAASLL
ncbi:guanine nucleotide-binding protein G(o) subunit alpha-like [Lineus longissimus]|uniref:guanine nucleotide-binding protein G(o) subunit alpha-like n=1 Tax=Lineus longissimus TaxID=88925 RepID=UPI002B4EEE23